MKKLMFAAVAAAVTTGAYALPTVYDYKASVKHMNLKSVSVSVKVNGAKQKVEVYQKYIKTASLKGYLIMDSDGATSQTFVADRGDGNGNGATGFDYGRNRGFLVVQNSSAEAKVRFPKIMPAVLDAKWIDTAFTKAHTAKSGIAEGTLFVGGDSVACVRSQFDDLKVAGRVDRSAAPVAPAASTPGMSAYADYVWTSIFLFGKYNSPNMFLPQNGVAGPFDVFETAWDANLPAGLQIGFTYWHAFYHDTWMNGAGFGKWSKNSSTTVGDVCCGIIRPQQTTWDAPVLVDLAGNLKGGLFLCTDNGIECFDPDYAFFDDWAGGRGGWDDQFVTGRLVAALGDTFMFAGDQWQWDMWQDGAVEQETTDVLFGTWSIKLNTKFFASKNPIYVAITAKDMENLVGGALAEYEEDSTGLAVLCGAIKGAALKLNKQVNFCDGSEIHAKYADPNKVQSMMAVPMVTPQFATYYGLANFK